ncbi:MAG TPA: acylphosphatase [Casimicrobiaceae bacterium]|nr:acylphosphatase [Casimicrobiaceae bacterium]
MTSEDPRPPRVLPGEDARLAEERIDGEQVFAGRLLDVRRDRVRLPDGSTATREYIVHPGAVLVVPMLDADTLVVERQFRYPGNRVFVEFPAGKLDAGETPLDTARRELREEAGYEAASWTRLGQVHTVLSYSTEAIDLWLAEGLTHVGEAPDDGEFLEVLTMRYADLVAAADAGSITDVKTIAALYHLERRRAARAPRAQVLRIRGRVQGVGFRDAMSFVAREAGVVGWVRNRSDDTVEAFVQGRPEALERIVAWARRGPSAARIDAVDVHDVPVEPGHEDFVRRPTR